MKLAIWEAGEKEGKTVLAEVLDQALKAFTTILFCYTT